ncbi:glutamyl-tRNA reductase [Variovorax boronicumulans]|uniref:glutamyl-tRNA reductase n=1 Tax=Variovorax boronicumulans TaxID=436515 RepID=UPI002473C23A|nr:glutamyl-tRNA reductase [Variovorax boronicumulans]MDH6170954.1 glutamyl-tRNA reductase [Variovorax boronicumulans]
MVVWALGLNQTSAPLNLPGRFSFALNEMAPALQKLRLIFGNADSTHRQVEAVILSTCNRTEIYCAGEFAAQEHVMRWLAEYGGVPPAVLRSHAYLLKNEQAARHAFRVTSGLDSMGLGESHILAQMKDAVRVAENAGMLGATLNQLFQDSFEIAKHVRTATAIGTSSIGLATAAVRLAAQLFEDLRQTRVLLVGAGEVIELAAVHFAARGARHIAVANRTLERGNRVVARVGGEVMPLSELPARLAEFDIVVSCTASILPLIGLGVVERALKQRRHRPMFMADLAVPRDIEPEVKALQDIYLYTIDDLAQVAHEGRTGREASVTQAEQIIDSGVQRFMQWAARHGMVMLIRQLNAQFEGWRASELSRARKRLSGGEDVEIVMEALSRGLAQKMLHGARAELRAGDTAERAEMEQTISRLFLREGR